MFLVRFLFLRSFCAAYFCPFIPFSTASPLSSFESLFYLSKPFSPLLTSQTGYDVTKLRVREKNPFDHFSMFLSLLTPFRVFLSIFFCLFCIFCACFVLSIPFILLAYFTSQIGYDVTQKQKRGGQKEPETQKYGNRTKALWEYG